MGGTHRRRQELSPNSLELLRQLRAFRVLDPACGSGNFLFVAYRALRELEQNLLVKLFIAGQAAV